MATPEKPPKDDVRKVLAALDLETFGEEDGYDLEGCWWWLCTCPNPRNRRKMIPCAFAGMKPYPDHGTGYLCRVGVLPKFRGRGLQRLLIQKRIQYARKIEMYRVISYTTRATLQSANNLIDCGFRLYKPDFVQDETDWLYFDKWLNK